MLGLLKTRPNPTEPHDAIQARQRRWRYFFLHAGHRAPAPLFREPETVALLLAAVEKVRSRHPFEMDAYVVLPDHLHALWTLPEGDANFSTRWRLIKEGVHARVHQGA